jgi:putative transposase
MKFDPKIHHRRSIRLKNYDYSQVGAYFVTIVTWHRECLFGNVVNGVMQSNQFGRIVQKWWDDIPVHFPGVETGAFAIMPNHIHGIIIITGRGAVPAPDVSVGIITPEETAAPNVSDGPIMPDFVSAPNGTIPTNISPASDTFSMTDAVSAPANNIPIQNSDGETPSLRKPTLGQIVAYLKYKSTKEMNLLDNTGTITKFWQRNYYEHIIRNADEANRIHLYIEANPAQWDTDDENPRHVHP